MTKEQILEYQYCSDYLKVISEYVDNLPFGIQKFGCGSSQPKIEFKLEEIHRNMFEDVRRTINDAKKEVQSLIDDI